MNAVSNFNFKVNEGSCGNMISINYQSTSSTNNNYDERMFVETVTLQANESVVGYQFSSKTNAVLVQPRQHLVKENLFEPDEKNSNEEHPKVIWVKQPLDFLDRLKVDIILQVTNLLILLL